MSSESKIACKICNAEFPLNSILKHIGKARKCRPFYTTEEMDDLRSRSKKATSEQDKANKRLNYKRLKTEQDKARKRLNYKRLKTEHETIDWYKRIAAFHSECSVGPIYPCICCIRELPPRSVSKVTISIQNHIFSKGLKHFVSFEEDLKINNEWHLCRNCLRLLMLGK